MRIVVADADLALFSINGDGYPTLPISVSLEDLTQPRIGILLGFKAGSWRLTTPAAMGIGQSLNPQKYVTSGAESRPGESGGPWVDLGSGKVVAVASSSQLESNGPSYEATPINLITGSVQNYDLKGLPADRDKAAYDKARGNPQLLASYAQSCGSDCRYKDAAVAEISSINNQRQLSDQSRQEAQIYKDARGDVVKLGKYVSSCKLCEFKAAANAEIVSNTREKCDRAMATPFDSDVPKSTPFMRDRWLPLHNRMQTGCSKC
jgi:hypothetical protein